MEVKKRAAKALVAKLSSVSEQIRTESLCELRFMSRDEPESRPIIVEAGAIPYLAEALYSVDQVFQENGAAALLNLSISCRDQLMATGGLLDALSHALLHPASPSTAQCTAATIFSLLTEESFRPIIGHKRDIVYGLIDMIRSPNSPSRSIKDGLKALFGVALYPLNRGTMIELGAVPVLFSLVVNGGRVGVLEDATAVIAQIAGCEESYDEFKKVSGIGLLVDLLDNSTGSTGRTKENAVSALLNLVQCGGEKVAKCVCEADLGAFDGIVDVAQNGSEKGKSKAIALAKVLGIDLQDSGIQSLLSPSS